MTDKVLVIVKDGQLVLRSTPGVETACIVDGEDVDLPDDWQDLPVRVVHIVPIRLEKGDFEQNHVQNRPLACPETQLAAPKTLESDENGRLEQQDYSDTEFCNACYTQHAPGKCPAEPSIYEDLGRS